LLKFASLLLPRVCVEDSVRGQNSSRVGTRVAVAAKLALVAAKLAIVSIVAIESKAAVIVHVVSVVESETAAAAVIAEISSSTTKASSDFKVWRQKMLLLGIV
jgi:hypothetical protein